MRKLLDFVCRGAESECFSSSFEQSVSYQLVGQYSTGVNKVGTRQIYTVLLSLTFSKGCSYTFRGDESHG